ncbi:MAG: IS66 family transposase, partial [Gammaproteobacteria bacterium]
MLSLLDVIDNKNRIIEDKDRQLEHYEKLITLLEEQLHLSKLQRFASSSEKSRFQIDLFDEAELE